MSKVQDGGSRQIVDVSLGPSYTHCCRA